MLFFDDYQRLCCFAIGAGKESALWEKEPLEYVGIRDGGSRASPRIPEQGHLPQLTSPEL